MTIILNGHSLDQEITNLESMIESIEKNSDQYLEVIKLLLKLKQKKISNMILAVDGPLTDRVNIAVSERLGTKIGDVDCSGIMYDSDDHYDHDQSLQDMEWHKKALCWVGIPRSTKQYKTKMQIRATPHPRTNLRQQMKALRVVI